MIIFPIPSKLSYRKKAMIRKYARKAELIDSEDSERLQLIRESKLLLIFAYYLCPFLDRIRLTATTRLELN